MEVNERAKNKAQYLYDVFYNQVPKMAMHFDKHRELAIDNALILVSEQLKTLRLIRDGLQSITCKIESNPDDLIIYWENVEREILKIKEK